MGRIRLVQVEAGYYSGARPDERPAWFVFGGERLDALSLVWERLEQAPGGEKVRRFRISVSGGREFTLRLKGDETYVELEDIS